MVGYAFTSIMKAVKVAGRRYHSLASATPMSLLFPKRLVVPSTVYCSPSFRTIHLAMCAAMQKLIHSTERGELITATRDDYRQVIDLNHNIYYGLDYLPSTYPHLVEGKGVQSFVYKVKGETVGFCNSLLLDGGQTVLFFCARVKDTLQGQGLYTAMWEARETQFSNRQLYPQLKRRVCISDSSKNKVGFHKVMKTFNAHQAMEATSLSKANMTPPNRQISLLRHQDVAQLFQSDPSCWIHLFPQRQFILGKRPYAVMADNLPIIQDSGWNTQFYGTKSKDGVYTLLSAGSYHLCQLGINYVVDIFGYEMAENDKNTEMGAERHATVTDHVTTHLQRLQNVCHHLTGKAIFNVFAPELLEDVVEGVTEGLETFQVLQPNNGPQMWEKLVQS